MMYIVTGAAGFIGANLVRSLNARGITDILAVDNLSHGDKFINLSDLDIADYLDKEVFLEAFSSGRIDGPVEALFHEGACSDTMEHDGRYMMDNNYRYSVALLERCQLQKIPFLYASSASVYGAGQVFCESREYERPLNVYAYSKFLFDQYVRRMVSRKTSQIVGFRYFNVYGPCEAHKNSMASVAFHFYNQVVDKGQVRLFRGTDGIADGMQRRDFIHVDDVVAVNLYFLDRPHLSGIFNLGTGRAQTFNDVACAVINSVRVLKSEKPLDLDELIIQKLIEYIPFPQALVGKYQNYTQANLHALRESGYSAPFMDVEQGISLYVNSLALNS
ncbi:MAG: ADP-glyceromanno-heptose 6-epimerase [Pseudomonadota bacterium]|nr:ADP-glyceromanno-heptose 6-epimerase [Pseudomonadota bacterium]